ncbi:hypothetical protein EV356DRAFT_532407 [Viridothelium virens]|uniref:Amino acid transporter n=1 Tax=Viridothelium virens TaxID=1048519 RepID=A0A6A6HA31_VIRVR|nr:hypothetical protein EV356DRAFT_532407 [Viridothelium virens]
MSSDDSNVSGSESRSAESSSSPTCNGSSTSHTRLRSSTTSTSIPPLSNDLQETSDIKGTDPTRGESLDCEVPATSPDIRLRSLDEEQDKESENTDFTEDTRVPRRNLGYIQTTSFMLNASLGYGIFTTPGYVLALTHSKEVCLGLWAVGGVYSALAATIFLEYGTALPFNGMALIYLDEVFPRPKLLATVIFSVFWIFFGGTVTLSKTVAQSILSVANPGVPSTQLSLGQLKFTAVVVQTVVCLLLYFVRRLCFVFNSAFALYKIIFCLVIFVAGMIASRRSNSGFDDFDTQFSGYNGADSLTAMIYILLCYQGWDSANYIAGEIKDCKRTLKWSAVTAISILTCLYMLVTLAFFSVTDYVTLTNKSGQANAATQFSQKVFGSTTGMQVAIALSVFSDQVTVTYTCAKVKQAIAWQGIIPFYRFFGKTDRNLDSPGGALLLHWVFTVIPLLAVNLANDQRPFFTGIYGYGYQVMYVFLGVGLPRLQSRMRVLDTNWRPTYLRNRKLLLLLCFIFVSMNIVILVIEALPLESGTTSRFYWPIALIAIFAFGIIYWAVLRALQSDKVKDRGALSSMVGLEVNIYEEGDENMPEEMRSLMRDAARDGSRRRVQYKVTGPASRCREGYYKFQDTILQNYGY